MDFRKNVSKQLKKQAITLETDKKQESNQKYDKQENSPPRNPDI